MVAPFVVFGLKRMTETQRAETLARYARGVLDLETSPTLPSPRSTDYDE